MVWIGFFRAVGHYNTAICDVFPLLIWDVGFVYEVYDVGAFRFAWHALGETSQFFAVGCRVELATFGIFIMWRYSMILSVYSLSTALIISMGKRRLDSFLGDSFICATIAHLSIASCATEQKFGFLLRVLEAGPLGGSTLGVGGMGGAGGVTLGGFVWGATLGGASKKSRLGSPWSNLSSGGSIGTGGDIGG